MAPSAGSVANSNAASSPAQHSRCKDDIHGPELTPAVAHFITRRIHLLTPPASPSVGVQRASGDMQQGRAAGRAPLENHNIEGLVDLAPFIGVSEKLHNPRVGDIGEHPRNMSDDYSATAFRDSSNLPAAVGSTYSPYQVPVQLFAVFGAPSLPCVNFRMRKFLHVTHRFDTGP